jgi:two-component system alkaline phosphatase synthesis response regulator PhoP
MKAQIKTFLVVDDELHVTHLLAHKLKQAGVSVLTAIDGQQGFELAMRYLPDVVITDLQMPVLSGYEMSVKLRTEPATSHIPVLMLTARGHKLSEQELSVTGIREVMSKPFAARQLIATAMALADDVAATEGDGAASEGQAA